MKFLRWILVQLKYKISYETIFIQKNPIYIWELTFHDAKNSAQFNEKVFKWVLELKFTGTDKLRKINLRKQSYDINNIKNTVYLWNSSAQSSWEPLKRQVELGIEQEINKQNLKELDENIVIELFERIIPKRFNALITRTSEIIVKKGK